MAMEADRAFAPSIWTKAMAFHGTATRDQLSILRHVLEEYCRHHGITSDAERNDAAHLLMSIFERGVSSFEGLAAGLEEASLSQFRHQSSAEWRPGLDFGEASHPLQSNSQLYG
jgi:hypothetical protein